MNIMTVKEASEKWGVTARRVNELVRAGRIAGVYKIGAAYVMPADAQKPPDIRITTGKYVGEYAKRKKKQKADKDGERK